MRRKITKGIKKIKRRELSLGYTAFAIGIIFFITKVSGIFKLQVITSIYTIDSLELDLFNAANVIPEFIFLIIAVGSFNAAIIPILTQVNVKEKNEKFNIIFSKIVQLFFIVITVICVFIFIVAPYIINFVSGIEIADRESELTQEDINLFTNLLRILILSPIILCISTVISCSLQVKKKIIITQLAPLFYNFGIIFIAVTVLPLFDYNILVLAFGVLLGSVLHLLIQLPSLLKSRIFFKFTDLGITINFKPKSIFPIALSIKDQYIKKVITHTLPRTVGLTSDYIGNIFQTILSLGLQNGSLTAFRLGLSVREIPNMIIGNSVAQAYFPTMSSYAQEGKLEELQEVFSKGVRSILFFVLPATSLLIVLRTPIVRFLFGTFNSSITFEELSLVSYIIFFLSFGVIFYSLIGIVNRVFFCLEDSKTPTYISIGVIIFELILTFALVNLFSHFNSLSVNPKLFIANIEDYFTDGGSRAAIGGIALASSISAGINLLLLVWFLDKKKMYFFYSPKLILIKFLGFIVMTSVGLMSLKFLDQFYNQERLFGVLLLTTNVSILMAISYYLTQKLMKDPDLDVLDKPTRRLKNTIKKVIRLIRTSKVASVGT